MDKEQKANSWGGARSGAGRKKTTAKLYGFAAPQDVVDILEAQHNRTSYILAAIRFYAQHGQE